MNGRKRTVPQPVESGGSDGSPEQEERGRNGSNGHRRVSSTRARSNTCRPTADGFPSSRSMASVDGRTQSVSGTRASAERPDGRPGRPCEGSTQPPQLRHGESACSTRRDPDQPQTQHRTRIGFTMHREPAKREPTALDYRFGWLVVLTRWGYRGP